MQCSGVRVTAMLHRAQGSSGTKREKHGLKTRTTDGPERERIGVSYLARMLEMNPTVIVCSLARPGPLSSLRLMERCSEKKDWRGTNLQKPKLCVLASGRVTAGAPIYIVYIQTGLRGCNFVIY